MRPIPRLYAGIERLQGYPTTIGVLVIFSAVPRFLKPFEEVYGGLGKTENVIAAAASYPL